MIIMDTSRLVWMIFPFSLSLYLFSLYFPNFLQWAYPILVITKTFDQMKYKLTFSEDKIPHHFVEKICFEQGAEWTLFGREEERSNAQRTTTDEDYYTENIIWWRALKHIWRYLEFTDICTCSNFPSTNWAKANLYFTMMIPIGLFAQATYFALFSLVWLITALSIHWFSNFLFITNWRKYILKDNSAHTCTYIHSRWYLDLLQHLSLYRYSQYLCKIALLQHLSLQHSCSILFRFILFHYI